MPYTNLLPNLSVADRDHYVATINQLITDMDFLVLLKAKEKQRHLRLGKKSETFFDTTIVLSKGNPKILTEIVSIPRLETRSNDLKHMKAIQSQINKINDAVNCTVIAMEQENIRECLYIYKLAQGAAAQNLPGARAIVEALETMLPRKGKKSVKKPSRADRNAKPFSDAG